MLCINVPNIFPGFFFSNKKRKEDVELESKNTDKNSAKSEKDSTNDEKNSTKMDSIKNGTNMLKPEGGTKIGN